MKSKYMEIKKIDTKNKEIVFDTQELFNQSLINDLKKIIVTNSATPTHTPKKFLDCFYLYNSGATYELYVYIANSWKKVTLS